MEKFVAYYRSSTQKQNLGLDAQKSMVTNFIHSIKGELVFEVIEKESGKKNSRTGIEEAIIFCEKNRCTLIIAKLDRLSRDVTFLFQLRERVEKARIEIKALDLPSFNTLTLGIYATIAQHEREIISSRTRAALQELKKVRSLGSPQNFTNETRKKGLEKMKENALNNDRNRQALALIIQLKQINKTLTEISNTLNNLNLKSRRGCKFHPETVRRLLLRNSSCIRNNDG